MADLFHEIGSDLDLDSTGDLRQTAGTLAGRQRVLRRLLTNPGDCIWHLGYGAGLAAFIGQVLNVPRLTAVIQAQMFRERAVAQSPAPAVAVAPASPGSGTILASVRYVDARRGDAVTAQLSIAP